MQQITPAGWYPDPQFPGQQRYWDGIQWTGHIAPLSPSGPVPPAQQQPMNGPLTQPFASPGQAATQKNWFLRHKVMSAVLAVIVIAVIGSAASSGESGGPSSPNDSTAASAHSGGSSSANQPNTTKSKAAKPKKAAKPEMTAGQANALGSAQDYLEFTAFSRKGLIRQLVSAEHFKRSNAIYAVNHVTVNWKVQAAKSAKDYLDLTHFSHAGLVQQLVAAEGFTPEQAEFGVRKAGL
jgi:hypothetical protein